MKRTITLVATLAFAIILQGQITTTLNFDAVSVKIAEKGIPPPGALQMKGGPGTSDPGRMIWGRTTLRYLLAKAWDVEDYRIVGPDVLDALPGYAITATMPRETTTQQFRLMLQNCVTERFQIRLHHETRMFPGYELIIAPGGPRLSKAADADAGDAEVGASGKLDSGGFLVLPPGRGQGVAMGLGGVHAKFQNYTIAEFATYFRGFIRQPDGSASHVADKTGLTGRYDFTLKFESGGGAGTVVVGPQVRASVPIESDEANGLPDVFSAVEKQLGLKLVKIKGFPLDTIVLDHVERIPLDN